MDHLAETRRSLNKRQTELRRILSDSEEHERAIQLFLKHHAALHSAGVAQHESNSYEDDLLDDMSEAQYRRMPGGSEHSVAWLVWHMARIEDVAMNMLVAGTPQLLHTGGWFEKMGITAFDTGNVMHPEGIAAMSAGINIDALRSYRLEVGRRTRQIVLELSPQDLKTKVDPDRIEKIRHKGAVVEEARALLDYWSKRTIAGLLLMPATRHNIVHLNEGFRVKGRK